VLPARRVREGVEVLPARRAREGDEPTSGRVSVLVVSGVLCVCVSVRGRRWVWFR
jgi:hypothetical protein